MWLFDNGKRMGGGKMKVYISGQITGLPIEDAKDNFYKVQIKLEEQGYKVVNPLENGLPTNAKWEDHMKADIKLLMDCNTIYLLSNWKYSRGATIEKNIAIALGYDIIEQIK